MDQTTDIQMTPKEELERLKAKADLLGVSYHPSIGADKLREKVAAAMADEPPKDTQKAPEAPVVAKETEAQRRARLKADMSKLVRIRVTCMNPAKKEWEGEIISAGNTTVGSFTKFVPFNADDGWHVPYFIYLVLKDRECQVFYTTKDSRGNKTRKGKLIKEFAIEVLPQLTREELQELAQRQAMAKSID